MLSVLSLMFVLAIDNVSSKPEISDFKVFNSTFGFSIDPTILNCPANKPSFFNPVINSPTAGTTLIICDINLIAPSNDTPRIQEMHILIGHVICHLIDQEFKA